MQQRPVTHVVCLIAPPGGGKGTIVSGGVERFGYYPFGFSEALAYVSKDNDHVAEQVERAIREKRLAPLGVVQLAFNLYRDEIVPEDKHILFDGFPRNADQVDILFETFAGPKYKVTVIYLDCPDDVCTRRILEGPVRLNSKGKRRPDDTREGVATRLKEYRELLPGIQEMVSRHKRDRDEIVTIKANQPPDVVFKEVSRFLFSEELVEK